MATTRFASMASTREHEPLAGTAEVDLAVRRARARRPPNIHNRIPMTVGGAMLGAWQTKCRRSTTRKKPGKSLKEKRADKKKKQSERRSG